MLGQLRQHGFAGRQRLAGPCQLAADCAASRRRLAGITTELPRLDGLIEGGLSFPGGL